MRRKGGGISPLQSPTEQGPKTDFFGDPLVSPRAATGSATTKNVKTMENYFPKSPKKKDATTEEKEEATSKASKPLAASQPMYKKITPVQTPKPKVMVSSTTKKVGLGAKKVGSGGGGLGLGAKKLNAKVDDRLFDQAPGEDVPVYNISSSNPVSPRSGGVSPRDSSGHVALPPKSNRFAYSEDGFGNASTKNETTTTTNRNEDGPKYTMGGLESVPMNSRRGASGHVTLDRNAGKKTNIDTRNFGGGSNASSSASRPPSGNNNSSRSAFGASPKYGNSESGGGGFGRNASSSVSTSTNPAAAGAANDNYYNATERFAGAKSISSDAFGSGGGSGNRTNNNDDGFGWDANRYAGESGFGSSDIRRGATSPRGDDLDLSASDLMEKISFQAKQDAAAFKNAASRGISGLKNMASSIFDELNR